MTKLRLLALPLLFAVLPAGEVHGQDDPVQKARELMHKGRYDKAEELLKEGGLPDPHERRLLMELALRTGRLGEADSQAQSLLALYQAGALQTADTMAEAANAAWRLDRWHEANEIYQRAAEQESVPAWVYIDWGNLYVEKYSAEAEGIFSDAIKLDPENPPAAAYIGLARTLKMQGRPGGTETLEKALELESDNLEAMALRASWAVDSLDWEEAGRWIDKGLEINASYLPLLECKAAMLYFRGEEKSFAQARDEVLKINPHDADLFETLGDVAVNTRRLEEAVAFYRNAVDLNPRQWSSWSSLGINLLRLGEEEEGRTILEKAYANDSFNIWTVNTLRLLDSFKRFETFETEHFRVRLREDEAAILRPYVEKLLERSLTTLEEKYNHRVPGKTTFEMFPDHEDFAVRTLGMPGLGALGATFGRVVAMDSPSGRPKGEFHWGSTLWHEVAHVVTLSLSNDKVPRWFTEGLSMMEERQAGSGWGDLLSPTFVRAYQEGKLLALKDLNDGFQRPKSPDQVALSYFQAGWICEHLASRFGFEGIRGMLVAYGEGKTTEEVFESVLHQSVDEVDAEFQKMLAETLKPVIQHMAPPAEGMDVSDPRSMGDIDRLRELAAEKPDNYFVNLHLGRKLLLDEKFQEAIPFLEKAKTLFPTFAGINSPYDLLVQAYRGLGDNGELMEALRQWWEVSPKVADTAIELAELLDGAGRRDDAVRYLEEAMYADPMRPEVHTELGRLYLAADRGADAVSEFQIVLAMKPSDIAAARYNLAQGLAATGERDAAKRQVLLALEVAPGYPEAQRLLLKLVQQ